MDNAGNDNSCAFTVSTYTQYHTRTWNTCKTGNDCVGGYVWSDCATKEDVCHYGCDSHTYSTDCQKSDFKEGSTCSQFSSNGVCYYYCTWYDNCSNCKTTTKECKGGDVWDSCKSRTPCVGGWNDWGGWSNGACLDAYTSTIDCEERTMYHGGS